jgi:hypothetical protein
VPSPSAKTSEISAWTARPVSMTSASFDMWALFVAVTRAD